MEGRNWDRCPLCKEAPSIVWMLSCYLSRYREPWGSLFWIWLDGCYANMPPTTFAKQSTELKPVHTYDGLGTENWTTQWLTLGVIFACINFRFGTSRHGGSQVFESMTGLLLNLPMSAPVFPRSSVRRWMLQQRKLEISCKFPYQMRDSTSQIICHHWPCFLQAWWHPCN